MRIVESLILSYFCPIFRLFLYLHGCFLFLLTSFAMSDALQSRFLIAAPTSGAGKTTVACGLMALLSQRGLKVQPFKCGPDYIDTKYHAQACRRPSINLDLFLAGEAHLEQLFARYAEGADVCVVEGMMGMYDGYDHDVGSSGDIARRLQLPVVLVVDARSAAYSIAPLLSGFINFRKEVHVAGVIFNRVGSDAHYRALREVCDDLGITCLGRLPRRAALEMGSRYLGLDFSQHVGTDERQLLVSLLEEHVDIPLLLKKTSGQRTAKLRTFSENIRTFGSNFFDVSAPHHIVVAANDESFSFIYQEFVDRLRKVGEPTFLNPEADLPIPADTDFLYLPGGYPEKHAAALSKAVRTKASIAEYIERGGRVLAECGGMIYLSTGICFDDATPEHRRFEPMVGVFPFVVSAMKEHRKLSLGYRRMELDGHELRGHEFHYTQLLPVEGVSLPPSACQVYNARGERVATPVFRYKNVVASYTHLYFK